MLLFITVLILLTAFLIYQYIFCVRVYYVGQALHKFRELRHEVTLYVFANVKDGMSIKEAVEYQNFLLGLNAIIVNFDAFASEFTKLNAVSSITSNMLSVSKKLTSPSKSNTIPGQYKGKLKDCYLTLFKAMPFGRLRFYLFFLRLLATLSFRLGISKYKHRLNNIEKLSQIEKDIEGNQGFSCNP
jgi:hypothetical protein